MKLFKENNSIYKKYKGSDCYYIDNLNNLYFKPSYKNNFKLMKDVQLNSFAFLSNNYSYDKERIYYESKCIKKGYSQYKDYKKYGYLKVDNILYWFGKIVKDNIFNDLINISEHFFTDNDKLFVNGKVFEFDKNSFSLLNRFYAKDKNIVFHSDEIIHFADAESFRVIREDSGYSKELLTKYKFLLDDGYSAWACDKNNLYFCGKPFLIGVIDPISTKIIRYNILIDNDNVFYENKRISDADPNSFQCIINSSGKINKYENYFFTSFFKDNQNIYYLYEDEKNESKNNIIKCTSKNRNNYLEKLLEIIKCPEFYNLEATDIERLNKLITE